MKNTLTGASRIMLLLSGIALVLVLFVPIWRIDLVAPQYPEGLYLEIHANGLQGNVDIINGLNHYIGMKTLHNDDFVEFSILPYCIIFFAAGCIAVAIINRRRWLNILFILLLLFGIIAMADFWRWEYDYGHNLDPNAAIVVPGMAYQPPLIGFKQLLNFGAYSFPDIGGFIFIGAGLLMLICVFMEWKRRRKPKLQVPGTSTVLLSLLLFFSSCNPRPEPIVPGKDNCYFCKMAITDIRFGAELITDKGRIYKFDDLHCLFQFTGNGMIDKAKVKEIYASDHSGKHTLVKAADAFILRSDRIHGPMNGDLAVFSQADSLKAYQVSYGGSMVKWEDLYK